MKVKLANITNNPVIEIYKAYRVCYSKTTQDNIEIPMFGDKPDIEEMVNFIVPLMGNGHTSCLEHVNMTFYINEVSRALMAQLTRHRTAKFSIQSQRYIDGKNFDFIVPPTIENNTAALEEYMDFMNLSKEVYERLIELGIDKEDARFVLTNATTCNITMTIDLHNFRNLFGLRDCKDAQWEIRELTKEMMRQVKEHISFADHRARRCRRLCYKCDK